MTVAAPAAGIEHTVAAIERLGPGAGPLRLAAVGELPGMAGQSWAVGARPMALCHQAQPGDASPSAPACDPCFLSLREDLFRHVEPKAFAARATSVTGCFRLMAEVPSQLAPHCQRLMANASLIEVRVGGAFLRPKGGWRASGVQRPGLAQSREEGS